MARTEKGALGTISGKVGNVIYYNMYGKAYARSRPDIRNDKQTPARLKQRQRLSLVTSFLQPFKDLLKITFAPITSGRSPYHTALSYNMKHAIKGEEYPHQEMDMGKVFLSAGGLELPEKYAVKNAADGLFVEWSGLTGDSRDALVVIAYNQQNNYVQYQFTGVPRYKESYLWDVDLSDGDHHVWIAFRSHDEKEMSNSLYLGRV